LPEPCFIGLAQIIATGAFSVLAHLELANCARVVERNFVKLWLRNAPHEIVKGIAVR
jgi:hypothetical protein